MKSNQRINDFARTVGRDIRLLHQRIDSLEGNTGNCCGAMERIASALEEKLCGCRETGDTNVTVNAVQQQQADALSDMEKRLQELKIASTGQALHAGVSL